MFITWRMTMRAKLPSPPPRLANDSGPLPNDARAERVARHASPWSSTTSGSVTGGASNKPRPSPITTASDLVRDDDKDDDDDNDDDLFLSLLDADCVPAQLMHCVHCALQSAPFQRRIQQVEPDTHQSIRSQPSPHGTPALVFISLWHDPPHRAMRFFDGNGVDSTDAAPSCCEPSVVVRDFQRNLKNGFSQNIDASKGQLFARKKNRCARRCAAAANAHKTTIQRKSWSPPRAAPSRARKQEPRHAAQPRAATTTNSWPKGDE